MGDGALTREFWSHWRHAAVPAGGWSGTAPWATQWPTLPQAQLAHWMERTTRTEGDLLRITAWVGDADGRPYAVMQAIWLKPPMGSDGQWISWREAMP